MAEKIRYTRRDLKGPDEFLTTFGRAVAWARENRLRVGAGALAVVAVFALVLGTRAYLQWKENKADRVLWPHLIGAREFLQSPGEATPEKLASLEQFLASQISMHPKTRAAMYAHYYRGSIAFLRGNYDLSAAQFRAGIDTGKAAGILEYLLRQGVAEALEAQGDFTGAAAAYRKAAEVAQPEMKSQSMLGEARVLALSGKKAEAAVLYRQVLRESPETKSRDLIEIQLAQLE